ncbi:hypothetical protein [Mycobacterium lepromatosis]|uniref:hypothetical protein n=1 Tax=Mycobacterium lepromatosis TaxID=480418 RepID=UPI000A6CCB6C|nr:hypothetical protein MLPF_1122 [Mycobacterium lepromatosis]
MLAIVPEGASGRAILPTLSRSIQRGADVFIIDTGPTPGHLTGRITLLGKLPDELSPLLEIFPPQ